MDDRRARLQRRYYAYFRNSAARKKHVPLTNFMSGPLFSWEKELTLAKLLATADDKDTAHELYVGPRS